MNKSIMEKQYFGSYGIGLSILLLLPKMREVPDNL